MEGEKTEELKDVKTEQPATQPDDVKLDITEGQQPIQDGDEDESIATIAKMAREQNRNAVIQEGSSQRQYERNLERAMHHNSHLFDSWFVSLLRISVTLFYMLTLMLALGFSLNALLQMHFAFFLPVATEGKDSTTTFST